MRTNKDSSENSRNINNTHTKAPVAVPIDHGVTDTFEIVRRADEACVGEAARVRDAADRISGHEGAGAALVVGEHREELAEHERQLAEHRRLDLRRHGVVGRRRGAARAERAAHGGRDGARDGHVEKRFCGRPFLVAPMGSSSPRAPEGASYA